MIRARVLACIAVLVSSVSARAQTQQVCFSASLPDQATNWEADALLPQFDSSLGTLLSVDVLETSSLNATAAVESLDATPTVVQLQFQITVTLTLPDGQLLPFTVPLGTFNDSLSASDGTLDFGGTSGLTHAGIHATDSRSASAQQIVPFLGPPGAPGNVALHVRALASSFASGGANLVTQFTAHAQTDVQVCYTYLPNVPPVFLPPSPQCGSTVMASAGVLLTFVVCAGDLDPADVVTLTGTLPPGATTLPGLPVSGNPACVTMSWTPTLAQVGLNQFTFTAIDSHLRTATCTISTLPGPECYQFIGRGGNGSNITIGGNTFPTFVGAVRLIHPVTMVDRPSIRIPDLTTGQLDFSMQTVMHNTVDFPNNPDQWSNRLRVSIHPGQVVTGQLFDTFNGIHQGLSTFTDPVGERFVTFPFTIDGM